MHVCACLIQWRSNFDAMCCLSGTLVIFETGSLTVPWGSPVSLAGLGDCLFLIPQYWTYKYPIIAYSCFHVYSGN